MLVLYDNPLSPYSQKIRIALREKRLEFQSELVVGLGLGKGGHAVVAQTPRAEIPVLVDNELQIFDSTVILEYLEDLCPQPALMPTTPAERARVRMLEDVMDTHYEAVNWGLSEIRWFRRAIGEEARAMQDAAANQLNGYFNWLEDQLASRKWFNGDTFGWGDVAVAPFVNGSVFHGYSPPANSDLASWLERANTHSSVALTVREVAEYRQKFDMQALAELVIQSGFEREYRDHRLEWMIKSGGVQVVIRGLERRNIRFTNFC